MSNRKKNLIKYIESDLFRLGKGISKKTFFTAYRTNKIFRFIVWFRLARYYNILNKKRGNFLIAILTKIIYKHLSTKYVIDFPLSVNVGYGLKINHGMALVVNYQAIIGNNAMLSHSVTLASEKNGVPIIGDKVRISPGVVIVGRIHIGNNVVIGANALVNKNVPDNSVSVGVPNRNIHKEFEEFTERYYYEDF